MNAGNMTPFEGSIRPSHLSSLPSAQCYGQLNSNILSWSLPCAQWNSMWSHPSGSVPACLDLCLSALPSRLQRASPVPHCSSDYPALAFKISSVKVGKRPSLLSLSRWKEGQWCHCTGLLIWLIHLINTFLILFRTDTAYVQNTYTVSKALTCFLICHQQDSTVWQHLPQLSWMLKPVNNRIYWNT